MQFKLPSIAAAATIEFFDAESVCIGQIEKTPQSNRKGKAIVVLEVDDIPAGSKYAQLVFEYEGKTGRSQMRRVESLVPLVPNAIPALQPYEMTTEESQESVDVVEKFFRLWSTIIASEAEERKAAGEQTERLLLYETMTDEDRQNYVDKSWRQGMLDLQHMSQQEYADWKAARARDRQKFDNWVWNWENHSHFIRGIKQLANSLPEEDNQAIEALLEAKRWGAAELRQVKEIVEAARRSIQV